MRVNKFILGAILLCSSFSYAASDRFGSERSEVARASFTDTSNLNVVIASATADGVGSLLVRKVIFSGVNPTTVTFYDGNLFTSNLTSMTRLEYAPAGTTGVGVPVEVNVDLWFSSGVMYNKQGLAPVTIKWDWMDMGEYKGKRGDSRP